MYFIYENCRWLSKNIENSNITFNLYPHLAIVTGYSIDLLNTYCTFTSWKLEGSINGVNYKTIDLREDDSMCANKYSDNGCIVGTPKLMEFNNTDVYYYYRIVTLGQRTCGAFGYYVFPVKGIYLYGTYINIPIFCTYGISRIEYIKLKTLIFIVFVF